MRIDMADAGQGLTMVRLNGLPKFYLRRSTPSPVTGEVRWIFSTLDGRAGMEQTQRAAAERAAGQPLPNWRG